MGIQEVKRRAQHDTQRWTRILWSSGGALELPKCSYHMLQTIFTATGAPVLRPKAFAGPITVLDDNNASTDIPQTNVNEAYRTLGSWQSPTKQQHTQYHHTDFTQSNNYLLQIHSQDQTQAHQTQADVQEETNQTT